MAVSKNNRKNGKKKPNKHIIKRNKRMAEKMEIIYEGLGILNDYNNKVSELVNNVDQLFVINQNTPYPKDTPIDIVDETNGKLGEVQIVLEDLKQTLSSSKEYSLKTSEEALKNNVDPINTNWETLNYTMKMNDLFEKVLIDVIPTVGKVLEIKKVDNVDELINFQSLEEEA